MITDWKLSKMQQIPEEELNVIMAGRAAGKSMFQTMYNNRWYDPNNNKPGEYNMSHSDIDAKSEIVKHVFGRGYFMPYGHWMNWRLGHDNIVQYINYDFDEAFEVAVYDLVDNVMMFGVVDEWDPIEEVYGDVFEDSLYTYGKLWALRYV